MRSRRDYDGDLKTDSRLRASREKFYVINSYDSTIRIENFGVAGDIPLPNDWDADSKADLTVYRAGAQGHFLYKPSMGNPGGNVVSVPWGTTGDKPVLGDYDADGRTDAAVYRPSSGVWYVIRTQRLHSRIGSAFPMTNPRHGLRRGGNTDLRRLCGGVGITRSPRVCCVYWGIPRTRRYRGLDGDGLGGIRFIATNLVSHASRAARLLRLVSRTTNRFRRGNSMTVSDSVLLEGFQ